jgi:hypothetical protein
MLVWRHFYINTTLGLELRSSRLFRTVRTIAQNTVFFVFVFDENVCISERRSSAIFRSSGRDVCVDREPWQRTTSGFKNRTGNSGHGIKARRSIRSGIGNTGTRK